MLLNYRVVTRPYATPVITATAYAAGDAVGELLRFPVPGVPTFLLAAAIVDKGNVKAPLTMHVFNKQVGDTADNAAWTLADADAMHTVWSADFANGDYISNGTANAVQVKTLPTPAPVITSSASGNRFVYVKLVTTGTPTYAVGDLMVVLTLGAG